MENKSWQEDLRETFGVIETGKIEGKPYELVNGDFFGSVKDLEQFISHLLTAQLEKIEEVVKGMNLKCNCGLGYGCQEDRRAGYNIALTDVLSLLSKLKENK